ncbi:uncharacterized protein TM35_000142780 [Trypanosoma theileri]|uniref:Uncharacterized protein n=1 Tax=Trypanosoma theileri TaxID=67003 RepID=A0A1X0NWI8_9TRYP|nr:uncharacterized protein TM35_000142780 [Trypanosoma theileri]ORC89067.1 hypothetical protein TM35_000142780 [Trypanosoma theileri]
MLNGETPREPFHSALIDHMRDANVVIQEQEAYLSNLRQQYACIQQELKELTEELLQKGLQPNLALLREKSQQLSTVFNAVDQLEKSMDNIHESILTLFATVNAIDSAPDVAGKASSFFASIGISLKSERANAGLWSRVPSYPMLKGRTPREFLEKTHNVFAPLYAIENS